VRGVDYYKLLGVQRDATPAEIRSAYVAQVKIVHPDVGGSPESFARLQEAYQTLRDAARRAAYDRAATPGRAAARTAPGGAARPARTVSVRVPATPRPRDGRPREFGEDPGFVPPLPRLNPDALAWWHAVDPDQPVRYLPRTESSWVPLSTVLGTWLVLLAGVLTLDLPAPLLVPWLALMVVGAGVAFVLARRHHAARHAQRRFAAEFAGLRVFGRPGTEAGPVGERLTATLLATYLIRLPGVRIFHGLALPGSVFADVDHAVLCGRRLVLVESKMWLPGRYTADGAGSVWRNGHPFRGGHLRLPSAVTAYRELLPGVEVRGVALVHPSRAGEVVTGDSADAPAPPMDPERFVREVGSWLAGDPATVDRPTFRAVLNQVVSA